MYQTTSTPAGRSPVLSRLFWLALIAIVLFGTFQFIGYVSSFVDPSRYNEIWYLAWL